MAIVPKISSLRHFIAAAILVVISASAAVEPAGVFADHMVLQRDAVVPVWGRAEPRQAVSVSFAGQTKTATAAADGRWLVRLDPLPASAEPRILVITDGTSRVEVADVLVGEVWLAGGQSNMRFPLSADVESAEVVPAAQDDQLRLWNVDFRTAVEPQDRVTGKWRACRPETAKDFSAVGYYFARELRRALGCPVGVICAAWGGTPIETWISLEGIQTPPTLSRPLERWHTALAQYRKLQADPEPSRTYAAELQRWRKEAEPAYNAASKRYNQDKAAGLAVGDRPQPAWAEPQNPDPMGMPSPSRRPQTPTVSFNGMIAPLAPFALRGVIWYQGEANGDAGLEYRTLFPRLIQDWRRQWGTTFPFLFVQLPAFGPDATPVAEKGWPWTREAQFLALREPATGMAVTIDVGNPSDVHPARKREVGLRLALLARRDAYGESLAASGPLFQDVVLSGGEAVVAFRETGRGLSIAQAPWLPKGIAPLPTDRLSGFFIAGEDRRWHEANARLVDASHVAVSSPAVPRPVAVRYAWANSPRGNLYHRDGLPAAPFRTDDWPPGGGTTK